MERRDLAWVYIKLSEKAVSWDMYWFANAYLDVVEILLDEGHPIVPKAFADLAAFAVRAKNDLALLSSHAKGYGIEETRRIAVEIDTAVANGREWAAPEPPPGKEPIQLGPIGTSEAREIREFLDGFPLNSLGGKA